MSEYVDTRLINCNRLASTESRSGNNSNPAVFTNPLNETIRLDVGDKISLERAFISEVGAGNSQTIEYKGVSRGTNSVATYTKTTPFDFYNTKSTTYDPLYRLGYHRSYFTEEVSGETVELRDNLAPLVYGYYITSNEYPNYIQQPRRFIAGNDVRGAVLRDYPDIYTRIDRISEGLPLGNHSINLNCICFADWSKRIDGVSGDHYKQKVDNTRFTLFVKDKIGYSFGQPGEKPYYYEQFPQKYHNGIFQECNYYRVRDRLDIEVNSGFNTPSAVANQITGQLTETKNQNTFEILDGLGYSRPITKTIETSTYKPINCQNMYNVNQATFTAYTQVVLPATAINVTQDAVDYISTFGYIAVKRPEIFEEGRKMHKLLNTTPNMPTIHDDVGALLAERIDPYEGFSTIGEIIIADTVTENTDGSFVLNVLYTKENLKIIRDFFDTQGYYPELWDNIQETVYYSDAKLQPNDLIPPSHRNSRFFHFNKYTTRTNIAIHNETFGDDAFTQRGGVNNIEMTSAPVFFYWKEDERDNYIEPKSFLSIARDGVSYGFATPYTIMNYDHVGLALGEITLIKIHNYNIGGIPRGLFTETDGIPAGNVAIKNGRRFGYDHHATAYSTAIITPYSGYANTDIGVRAVAEHDNSNNDEIHSYPLQINHIRAAYGTTNNMTDFSPYMTQTYIGANNPAIEYNNVTNRFELKRLHTGNNIGNLENAGSTAKLVNSKSMTPSQNILERDIAPTGKNVDAGNTVYKINPRPPQFGFSPTFKPYLRYNQALRSQPYPENATSWIANYEDQGINTNTYAGFNFNIEPYEIFDSHGGIYIDDWGFDENNWEDNFWDILGFDYDAVAAPPSSKNMLSKRVDNDNSNALYRPTTNAQIVQTDTKNYVTNQFGAVQYYTSLPYPTCIPAYIAKKQGGVAEFFYLLGDPFTAANAQPLELWNEVAVLTQSTTITATDIQKSVLRPYYTIRSNILEGATAIGGNPTGSNLPIIGIVDKYSAASDYFMGNPSDIQFTVTKQTMIADITTSIHDSDGEYANVDKTSAVIYKIEKIKRTPVGIIEEILGENKKNKK